MSEFIRFLRHELIFTLGLPSPRALLRRPLVTLRESLRGRRTLNFKMNTPDKIYALEPNQIFVFGSNLAGRHGLGAAKQALKFGARYRIGLGLMGQTYAIPTKGYTMQVLPLEFINDFVGAFLSDAEELQHLQFLVTQIGCGLAGYSPSQIGPMFANAPINVVLPKSFTDTITHSTSSHPTF